jgi:hypothetical protein
MLARFSQHYPCLDLADLNSIETSEAETLNIEKELKSDSVPLPEDWKECDCSVCKNIKAIGDYGTPLSFFTFDVPVALAHKNGIYSIVTHGHQFREIKSFVLHPQDLSEWAYPLVVDASTSPETLERYLANVKHAGLSAVLYLELKKPVVFVNGNFIENHCRSTGTKRQRHIMLPEEASQTSSQEENTI